MADSFEQFNTSSEDAEKQERIEKLQELRKHELKRLQDSGIDVSKFEESAEPIDYRLEDDRGSFMVEEGEDGFVDMKIKTKDGESLDLSNVLPDGHRVIGHQLPAYDLGKYGLGRLGSGSEYLDEHKEILINEKELKEKGWKYIWTLLHEIGHAVTEERFPDIAEAFHQNTPDEANVYSSEFDPKAFLEHELATSRNEAYACYVGAEMFQELLKEHPFLQDIFQDEGSIDEFYEELMRNKGEWVAEDIDAAANKNEDISEEEKERLKEKIFEMYSYNPIEYEKRLRAHE